MIQNMVNEVVESETALLVRRIRDLECVILDLVDAIEQGQHIDYSEELQDLVRDALATVEGEFED